MLILYRKHAVCLKDYRIRSFLSIQFVHCDLRKHLGIDSSTDHPDRYSNLFELQSVHFLDSLLHGLLEAIARQFSLVICNSNAYWVGGNLSMSRFAFPGIANSLDSLFFNPIQQTYKLFSSVDIEEDWDN